MDAYDRDGPIADGVLVNDGEHAMTVIGELLACRKIGGFLPRYVARLRTVTFHAGCTSAQLAMCLPG